MTTRTHTPEDVRKIQRQWVSLTDEEMVAVIYKTEGFEFGLDNGNVSDKIVVEYARLIEAELKEKNWGFE